MTERGRYGRPLSAKPVRSVHTALRRALGDAERLGVIARNAARMARQPTYHRPEMQTWSAEDLGRFLEHARTDRLYAAFVLLATTGMRRGEVMGLRWRDVNLDAGWLSVEQTLTTVEDRIFIGPAKTPRSRRRIALDPATIAVLRRHRVAQAEERLAALELWVDDNDLVFRQEDRAPVHPDVLTRRFKRLAAEGDLPKLRGAHNLRRKAELAELHQREALLELEADRERRAMEAEVRRLHRAVERATQRRSRPPGRRATRSAMSWSTPKRGRRSSAPPSRPTAPSPVS